MRRVGAVLALALAGATACGGVRSDLGADDRVAIVAPVPLQVVTPPIDISWEADGVEAGLGYAVFVDRDPIGPDERLADAFEEGCEGPPDCLDTAILAAHDIYLTSETSVSIPRLLIPGGIAGAARTPVHRATVVLVDGGGRRLGEAAWSIEFRVADR